MITIILNLLWFLLGGFLICLLYFLGGVLMCLTIVGIPFGVACFRLGLLAAFPFGRTIEEKQPPGGAIVMILNIVWIILPGLELAIIHLLLAAISAITIIGLPFAKQHIKLVRMAILPFGYRSQGKS